MHIARVIVENYKSIYDRVELEFHAGFTFVVGANNSGKTALIEALGTKIQDVPHRSHRSVPRRGVAVDPTSKLDLLFVLDRQELLDLLPSGLFQFPLNPQANTEAEIQALNAMLDQPRLACRIENGAVVKAFFEGCADSSHRRSVRLRFDQEHDVFVYENGTAKNTGIQGLETHHIAEEVRNRVFFLQAERFNITVQPISGERVLRSDARNLPVAVHALYIDNRPLYDQLMEAVNHVIPDVQFVSPTYNHPAVELQLWSHALSTQRDDLRVPMAAAGTGIGQVLAILLAVMESQGSRTIVIDEPQSFLHPGAVRRLFSVLQRHDQHQYIVTTHSPVALTSVNASALILVSKPADVSEFEVLDPTETRDLATVLAEVGARLSDVFGCDQILWVEGRTEEEGFPIILQHVAKFSLGGTAIRCVVDVGDFRRPDAERIVRIYDRLSTGRALLPVLVGFVFDQDGRTEQQQDDIKRRTNDSAQFLDRRMFENYLLYPDALATVLAKLDPHRPGEDDPITAQLVEGWLDGHKGAPYYEAPNDAEELDENHWRSHVHAANLLEDLFKDLTDQRVNYSKVRDGLALTEFLVENDPERFRELVDQLVAILTPPVVPPS